MNVGMGADEGNVNASASRCADGVGIVEDGGMSLLGGADGVGAVVDRGATYVWARTFTAADVASSFACLPDHSLLV